MVSQTDLWIWMTASSLNAEIGGSESDGGKRCKAAAVWSQSLDFKISRP